MKEFESDLPDINFKDPLFPEENEISPTLLSPKSPKTKGKEQKRTPMPYERTVRDDGNDINRSNTDTNIDIATSLKQGRKTKTDIRMRVRYPFEYYKDELDEFLKLKVKIRTVTGEDVSYSRMAREAMNDYRNKINSILKQLSK